MVFDASVIIQGNSISYIDSGESDDITFDASISSQELERLGHDVRMASSDSCKSDTTEAAL